MEYNREVVDNSLMGVLQHLKECRKRHQRWVKADSRDPEELRNVMDSAAEALEEMALALGNAAGTLLEMDDRPEQASDLMRELNLAALDVLRVSWSMEEILRVPARSRKAEIPLQAQPMLNLIIQRVHILLVGANIPVDVEPINWG